MMYIGGAAGAVSGLLNVDTIIVKILARPAFRIRGPLDWRPWWRHNAMSIQKCAVGGFLHHQLKAAVSREQYTDLKHLGD
jgi:hypothetical protein